MKLKVDKITNLQLELMKIFSYELSERELIEIKELLSSYFAKKASDEIDKLWEEREWSDEVMNKWLRDHNRIEYT
jgi:hypothetical protein